MLTVALSGLNASSKDLAVTANNIANVGTSGFKKSRTEFGDIFNASALGSSKTAAGSGVSVAQVKQLFQQGDVVDTAQPLDLAVTGKGLFAVSANREAPDLAFTRAGSFGIDKEGYVVNAQGQYLQTFPVDGQTGDVQSTAASSLKSLYVADVYGAPTPSTKLDMAANLPAKMPDLPIANFDPADAATYSKTSSSVVYDSLGNSHTMQVYFVKTDSATNAWETRTYLDGNAMTPAGGASQTLTFNTEGQLTAPANGEVEFDAVPQTNGASPMNLKLDFTPSGQAPITQFEADFFVSTLRTDGAATGRLTGLEITEEGIIKSNYTNGKSLYSGKLAIGDFTNEEGLSNIGNTTWRASNSSGDVRLAEAGAGNLGRIRSGALEMSNVDLTKELVGLIQAQRNFQANAKSIETSNTINQAILNL